MFTPFNLLKKKNNKFMKKLHVSKFILVALCFCSVIVPGHSFSVVMGDDEGVEYFNDNDISTVTDHNFSDNISSQLLRP